MITLNDLLEVIEVDTKLMIIDWTGENHKVIYFQKYDFGTITSDDINYKVVSMEQSLNYIIINVIKMCVLK